MRQMTFSEKFHEIRELLLQKNTKACKDFFAIQVTMTDGDCGGTFYLVNNQDGFAVEPYDYRDYTAHVIAESEVLIKILNGTADPVREYLAGTVKIDGNLESVRVVSLLKNKRRTTAKQPGTERAEKKTSRKAVKK